MGLKLKLEENKMNTYKCIKCGHEVLSNKQPEPIRWTDGHVCCFQKQSKELKQKIEQATKESENKTKKRNFVALLLHYKKDGSYAAQFQVRADKDFLSCEIYKFYGERYITKSFLAGQIKKYYNEVLAEIRNDFPNKHIVRVLKTVD